MSGAAATENAMGRPKTDEDDLAVGGGREVPAALRALLRGAEAAPQLPQRPLGGLPDAAGAASAFATRQEETPRKEDEAT